MPIAVYVPSKLSEGHFTDLPIPGAGDNGKAITWNNATGAFVYTAPVAPGGSTTQVQYYGSGGAFAGHTGLTYDGAGALTVAGRVVTPVIRPASDSTTALQVKTTAGTSVLTVDTTNGYLYLPDPTATTRLQLRPTGLYLTTNSGTSINSFVMSGLETTIDSRSTLHMKTNGVTWLSGGTAALAFVAATISFSDSAGGISMVGALLRGSNHLGLQAADNRFTVTVKQNSNASGTADILRVQTQSGGAALYVDVNGYVAIGQSSAAALLDLAASTTVRASLRIRSGTAPTTPNAGDVWYPSGGRLSLYRAATEIFATGVQGAGGAATATGTWGATEQAMLQAIYDAGRAFGLLS